MATPLSINDFPDDGDQSPYPLRWLDQPAGITNAQLMELKHAIDQQGSAIAELQADLMTNRERLTAAEKTIDDYDVTLTQHDDRLDSIEHVLGSDQLPTRVSPALLPSKPPVPDMRMVANHGEVRELPSLELLAQVHEASTALARLYRRGAGVTDLETAMALFRVGWEQSADEPEVSLETAWSWLQSRGKQLD